MSERRVMPLSERDAVIGARMLTWAARRMTESAYVCLKSSGARSGDDPLEKMLREITKQLWDAEEAMEEALTMDEMERDRHRYVEGHWQIKQQMRRNDSGGDEA